MVQKALRDDLISNSIRIKYKNIGILISILNKLILTILLYLFLLFATIILTTVTTTNTPTKPNIISIKELYPSWLSGDIVKNIPHKTKTITNKLAIDALFMVFPPLKNTILMPLFLVKKSH